MSSRSVARSSFRVAARTAERDPGRDLLAIQRRLWRRLKSEIDATIAENPANVEIYQEEYERDLSRYEALSSKRELVSAAAQADLVYLGDYHTLPQAQKTLVKLLLALTRLDRRVVLGMEMVHIRHQNHLNMNSPPVPAPIKSSKLNACPASVSTSPRPLPSSNEITVANLSALTCSRSVASGRMKRTQKSLTK